MKKKIIRNFLISGMILSMSVSSSLTAIPNAEIVAAAETDQTEISTQTEKQTGTTDVESGADSAETNATAATGSEAGTGVTAATNTGTGTGATAATGSEAGENGTTAETAGASADESGVIGTEILEEAEVVEGTETEESSQAIYSGEDGSITWSIDEDGLLQIDGDGNCEDTPDWLDHADEIKYADVDIINVTDMGGWFMNCENLLSIDFSDTDTSAVQNMSCMFYGCSSLTSLDLSGFDTSAANDMGMMFYGCENLLNLDLSSFDTSNVTTWSHEVASGMAGMFAGCYSLQNLNISSFDTSGISDLTWMFYDCCSLQELDLSGFDTSSVLSFDSMLRNCSALTSLDLSNFDTSQATNMANMFDGCCNLNTLNLDSFTFEQTENVSGMFANCYALNTEIRITVNMQEKELFDCSDMFFDAAISQNAGITLYYGGDCPETLAALMADTCSAESLIDVKKMRDASDFPVSGVDVNLTWTLDENGKLTIDGSGDCAGTPGWLEYASDIETADVNSTGMTSMSGWFASSAITSVDFSDADTSLVTDLSMMFEDCKNLTELDLSTLNTDSVTNMSDLFASCARLQTINMNGWNTANVTTMSRMFYGCKNLLSLDLSGFNTSNVADMSNMFSQCYYITDINLSSFDTSQVTDMGAMFSNCYRLESLDLSNFDTSSVFTWSSEVASGMAAMFSQCTSLTSLDLSSFDTSGVQDMTWMFYNCDQLQELDLSSFNTSNVTSMGWMFSGCGSLTSLDLSNFDTSNVNSMYNMFADCTQLVDLNLDSFTFANAENFDAMFSNCENIRTSLTISTNFEDKDYYNYADLFYNAATSENAQIILYYNGKCTLEIVTNLANTCSENSRIFIRRRYLTIKNQPQAQTVVAGEKFLFTVTAESENEGTLSYLWQYSKDGGETWTDTTRTKDNYTTTATTALNGRLFRCVVTDAEGNSEISRSAMLTVRPAIEITSQTDAQTVNVGELYKFRVAAVSNTGSKLTYLWQYSKTLKGWTDTTRTVNNYGTYATVGVDGKYFRCKITDEAGNVVYSTPAMVRVLSDITISEQPTDTTVEKGKRYYFTVTATGSSLTYKWEYSKDGGTTWLTTTRTKNNYTTYAKKAMNGWMFRCVITDSSNNTVTTEAGTLTVN